MTGRAVVSFRAQNRYIRFAMEIPLIAQEERQRWRALVLVIKAKLEAVESGITTFENEFLAHIVLPDNRTVGEWLAPQIDSAYEEGGMPKLLMPITAEPLHKTPERQARDGGGASAGHLGGAGRQSAVREAARTPAMQGATNEPPGEDDRQGRGAATGSAGSPQRCSRRASSTSKRTWMTG